MFVILLVILEVSSSTASTQCPRSNCRCPDYRTTICSRFWDENLVKLTDSRLVNLDLDATNISEVVCDILPEGIEKLSLRNHQLSAIYFDCLHTLQHLEIYRGNLPKMYASIDQNISSVDTPDYIAPPNLRIVYLSRLKFGDDLVVLLKFFRNVTELYLIDAYITYLPYISDKLPNIRKLDLSKNTIGYMTMRFFRYVKGLESLLLERTGISRLKEDVFHPLELLTFLKLDGNRITSLENGTFSTLNNLQKLRLSQNRLTSFQSALTANLAKLEELYLNENRLTELEENVFDSLINIKILNLTLNSLRNIPKNVFKNQQKLQRLYFGWNMLTKLEPDAISPLQNLHIFNLEGNRLTFLENGTFEKLSHLKILNLSSNLLEVISGVQFPAEAMLHTLFLQNNKLVRIDTTTFQPLGNLGKLRLDSNYFRNMNVEAFGRLEKLKYLNFSGCNMLECNCSLEKLWKHCKLRNITLDNGAICYEGNNATHWSDLRICPAPESETGYTNIIIIIVVVVVLVLLVAFPIARYFLLRSRSEGTLWSPPRETGIGSAAYKNNQATVEEDYDVASTERKVEFSTGRQEDYVEPTVPKVMLPTCLLPVNPSKSKKPEDSPATRPMLSSDPSIPIPRGRAPAPPPED